MQSITHDANQQDFKPCHFTPLLLEAGPFLSLCWGWVTPTHLPPTRPPISPHFPLTEISLVQHLPWTHQQSLHQQLCHASTATTQVRAAGLEASHWDWFSAQTYHAEHLCTSQSASRLPGASRSAAWHCPHPSPAARVSHLQPVAGWFTCTMEARGGRQSLPALLTLGLPPQPMFKKVHSAKVVHF